MNVIFIAPPAAGKGTMSSLLAQNYDYKHISTGDLLRNEVKSGSELGTKIKEIIDNGKFVSDDLITNMLSKELSNNVGQNFILDGYPRTLEQVKLLDNLFNKLEINDYIVIYLNVDKEIAIKRSLGRVLCPKCGKTYNEFFKNQFPKESGKCDACGIQLVHRSDDTIETFTNRFDTYLKETYPILNYYKSIDKLVEINANLLDPTFKAICNALDLNSINKSNSL